MAYPQAEYHDVVQDPAALKTLLHHSGGQRKVPVVVQDGKATVGYNGGS